MKLFKLYLTLIVLFVLGCSSEPRFVKINLPLSGTRARCVADPLTDDREFDMKTLKEMENFDGCTGLTFFSLEDNSRFYTLRPKEGRSLGYVYIDGFGSALLLDMKEAELIHFDTGDSKGYFEEKKPPVKTSVWRSPKSRSIFLFKLENMEGKRYYAVTETYLLKGVSESDYTKWFDANIVVNGSDYWEFHERVTEYLSSKKPWQK